MIKCVSFLCCFTKQIEVSHHYYVLFIASVFFCTYDTIKKMFSKHVDPVYLPVIHMVAACAGETVSQTRWAILNTMGNHE